MSASVDDTDRRVPGAPLDDARESTSERTERAGITTVTATKRLRRLETSGVVDGY